MQRTVSHIGIAVKDLDSSKALFAKLFGVAQFHEEIVESNLVKVASFPLGDVVIELTEALSEDSPIAKFIAKRGEGFHHVAINVPDISSELNRLASEGFTPLSDTPARGAHGALVAFLHPKTTNGILVELCQPGE